MEIDLKDVTRKNWKECIALKTEEYPGYPPLQYERYMASNCLSLAQAKVEPKLKAKAIYTAETMVGFTLYGYCEENQFYEIYRIMIDWKYQQKGYGRKALQLVIDDLSAIDECKEIYISEDPSNAIAIKIYTGFGFQKIPGNIYPNEIMMKKKVK